MTRRRDNAPGTRKLGRTNAIACSRPIDSVRQTVETCASACVGTGQTPAGHSVRVIVGVEGGLAKVKTTPPELFAVAHTTIWLGDGHGTSFADDSVNCTLNPVGTVIPKMG